MVAGSATSFNAPSGTSRASRCASDHSPCFLPPVAKLLPVRWVAVGPGGGVCGAVARTKRRSDNIRAVAVVPPLRCAAFRHVGARRECPGPPLRPAGCRARLNRRPNHGRRYALGLGGGSACPLALRRGSGLGLRLRSRSLPAARSARPGARERPRGSASFTQPRGHRPN